MGKLNQGILGGFSGKVSNVVGTSWKGIAVIKSRPLSVANPQTAGQTAQRNKFSAMVALAGSLLSNIIKPLWDRFAQRASGYNEFIGANIDTADAVGDITWADVITSRGSLTGYASVSFDVIANGSADIVFDNDTNTGVGNAAAGDLQYIAVYNETQDNWGFNVATDDRTVAAPEVTMPTNQATDDVVHAYFAFRRADGTLVSNSSYITTVVV